MLSLSLKELKAVAKIRGIKGYESISKDNLLRALKSSELLKERIKEIREKLKYLKHKFSKSDIKRLEKIFME